MTGDGGGTALLARAAGLHQAGRLAEAERLYAEVLDGNPRHPDALHLLGVLCAQSGRASRAVDLITAAVAIRSGVAAYHANLGRALRAAGRPAEAADSLRRALALQPSADGHQALGNVLRELGRAGEAEAAYRAAIGLAPDAADSHLNRATALESLGRAGEAEACLRRAVALRPDDRVALFNMARTEETRGRAAIAPRLYHRAVRLAPDFDDARANLGLARLALGQAAAAAAVLRRDVAARPQRPAGLLALAEALAAAGDTDAALAVLPRMARLAPGDLAPWERRTGLLADAGRFAEAAAILATVARMGRAGRTHWKAAYYVLVRIANRWLAQGRGGDTATLLARASAALAPVDGELHAWSRFLEGALAARTGDAATARLIFDGVAHHLPFLAQVCLGDEFAARVAACPEDARARLDGAFHLETAAAGTGPIVLVSCDAGYLARFGRMFLSAMAPHARAGQRVHLHILDPRPDTASRIAALAGRFPHLAVGWSREPTPPHLSDADRPWFYAAARFLRLERLVRLYGAPLLVADADACLFGDPAAWIEALPADCALGLQVHDGNLAWVYDGIGGALTMLRPEPAVLDWCARLNRFLTGWIAAPPIHWCLDQIALVAALDDARRRGTGLKAFPIPLDGRRYRLAGGVFVQLFEEKARPGFDADIAAFLDQLDREPPGLYGPDRRTERFLAALGLG